MGEPCFPLAIGSTNDILRGWLDALAGNVIRNIQILIMHGIFIKGSWGSYEPKFENGIREPCFSFVVFRFSVQHFVGMVWHRKLNNHGSIMC